LLASRVRRCRNARFTTVSTPESVYPYGYGAGAAERITVRNGALGELGLRLAPLLVPDGEASDVHLDRLSAAGRRGYSLDHEGCGDDPVAGVAFLAVAWTDPESRDPVQWEMAVPELVPNERTNVKVLHGLAWRIGGRQCQIHRSLDARERQTGEAGVQAPT
jgi:hypothetical protein